MSESYPYTEAEKELIKAVGVDLYRALKAVYSIIDANNDLSDLFIDRYSEILEQVERALNAAIGEF